MDAQEAETCVICREPLLENVRILTCGHVLHTDCLHQLRRARMPSVRERCPVCRDDIRYVPVYIHVPSDSIGIQCFRVIILLALFIFLTIIVLIIRDETAS